ncbi:Zn finger protein HypA/HybF involved in hydrogenase expression [Neobacillus drentensis]|nr:Zn finger protein HypA/HybF involved in hydrogenase expression [Neobacillus drentensis]
MNCKKCGKEFYFQVTEMNVPGGKEREYINCPHCGETNGSVVTSGVVYIHKIEESSKN